ncbi:MAG: class I tRNA ligase family protein, partial [Oscillospiraceae bacterium]|nr:class I tRNA ligase family protein [Oscillospiraceae bacterium]
WAGSVDYHVDVGCSKDIFKQLSQNYLKFRNTARYCLGNLDGFDANHLVKPEEMLELDRWAMTRLNKLIETGFKAYDNYEFHVLTHAINDFCVVELSQFYLDILKDRLYCEARDGLKRRSAQTALYLILDTMAKLFAPILAFTADEIWQAMPHRAGDDPRNILFNDMNQPFTDYALDDETMAKWDTLIKVREDVNGVLEQARAEKRIGKALEAQVRLLAQDETAKGALDAIRRLDLAELFIVSAVSGGTDSLPDEKLEGISAQGGNFPGLLITVSEAAGTKCPRCWMQTLQANAEGLCPRCAKVVETLL